MSQNVLYVQRWGFNFLHCAATMFAMSPTYHIVVTKTLTNINMLPIDIRNSRSLNVFERILKLHFPSPIKMPWFSVSERFVNIHHTRIRIGCSKLKAHLHFNLHVEDDPSCRCGSGIEDPYHMPLVCSDNSNAWFDISYKTWHCTRALTTSTRGY